MTDISSANQLPEESGPKRVRDWRFGLALLVGTALLVWIVIVYGGALFSMSAAKLPLLLPLVVTVLSIFTRGGVIRTYESLLKISNDVAIGIISFDIWALLATRSDPEGRILVDTGTMIKGDFGIPFLLSGLVLTVGCVVLTHYPFQSDLVKSRCLLAALLLSVVVYIAPFSVLQPIPPPKPPPPEAPRTRSYTVIVPYRDPGITQIAPSYLSTRYLAHFERDVLATGIDDAKAIGLQRFLASPESSLVRVHGERVLVKAEDVLALEE